MRSGRWIKAGFHCHTVNSDGGLSPDETLLRYREAGYDCVAITDHRQVTRTASFSTDSFIAIDSIEVGIWPDVIGIGATAAPSRDLPFHEAVCCLNDQGAFAVAAHPTYCGAGAEAYLDCPNLGALEIYNAYCEEAYANGVSVELWDMLLGSGRRVWGVATDDAHLNEAKRYYSDAGRAWVEVLVEELSQQAILRAMKEGAFYSTQGPRFTSFEVKGSNISFECSPVRQIRWRTRGPSGYVEYATSRAGLRESSLPAGFRPRGYARVELVDEEGLRAWSNPFFVADEG
jgi:hypothetical protein